MLSDYGGTHRNPTNQPINQQLKMHKNLSAFSSTELIQRLANAMKTGATCGGHTKAHHNHQIASEYREELTSRGESIPPNEELYAQGTFNGAGSF